MAYTQESQFTGGGSGPIIPPYSYSGSSGGAPRGEATLVKEKDYGGQHWGLYRYAGTGEQIWQQMAAPAAAPEPPPPIVPSPPEEPGYVEPISPAPAPEPWPRYEFPEITMPTYSPSQYPTYSPPPVPSSLTQPLISQTAPAPQFNYQPAPAPAPAPPRIDWMAEAQKLLGQADVQDIIRDLEAGLGPIRNTLQQLLAISPEDIESRYQAEIAAPAQRYYEEQTLPSLRRSFVGPGTFWSSMRAGAEQRSGARLGEALMGERSRMYGQAQQTALSAAGQAKEVEQQAFAGRTYPYEMALKGAPLSVEQRGQEMARDVNLRAQNLQQEYQQAQIQLQTRAQDLETQLAQSRMEQERYLQAAQLGYMSEAQAAQLSQQSAMHQATINLQLEQLRQRERELWGYLNPLGESL